LLGLLYLVLININNRAFLLADVLTKDLQESKEKFRIVADFTYSWEYWERDDQEIVYMSPSCKRITGYEPQEFISDVALLKTIVHPDDVALFAQHKNSVSLGEHRNDICEVEFRVIRKDGAILHMYHLCRPILNEQKEYLGRRVSNRDITDRKLAETERERMITELQGALEQIKTLKGIVPICSDCKKVRDDKGYWEQVESYVQRHSDAQFSHGLCPDCVEKYFPKYGKDIQNNPKT
jgi:PAS domain S-box-containing protein